MFFVHGLLLGLGTAFILGPVFFTLLRNSLASGRSAGIATAIGIILSDLVVLLICIGMSEAFLEGLLSHAVVHHLAAALLLFFGMRFMFATTAESSTVNVQGDRRKALLQGFLINGVNPVVFGIWLGFIAIGQERYSDWQLWLYLSAILLGIFVTDLLKALYAPALRRLLSHAFISKLYKLIGGILLFFGIRLLYLYWV